MFVRDSIIQAEKKATPKEGTNSFPTEDLFSVFCNNPFCLQIWEHILQLSFYGHKIINKIALIDITKVRLYERFFYTFGSFKVISIKYLKDSKYKTLFISEDLFPYRELILIFKEFTRYTISHNISIIGPKYLGEPFY